MQMHILNINYTILTAGFIGNILNILMFTKLTIFHNNSLIYYLTIESLFDNIEGEGEFQINYIEYLLSFKQIFQLK